MTATTPAFRQASQTPLSRVRMVRPQYHFRSSPDGLLAWDVRRLIRIASGLPVRQIALASIEELNEDHWYSHGAPKPTCKSVVEHCALILAADPSFPIILDSRGRVMDGMHRVCKALMEGRNHVPAVQFQHDPDPDFVNRPPESLPYSEE